MKYKCFLGTEMFLVKFEKNTCILSLDHVIYPIDTQMYLDNGHNPVMHV